MKGLVNTLRFILQHPMNRGNKLRSLYRFIEWQLHSRIVGRPRIFILYDNVKMYVAPKMYGATGNYYCGLHEYEHMMFLLDHLSEGDVFYDVGANVGSYSLLAAGVCKAKVVAFEPNNDSVRWLNKNIAINKFEQQITLEQIAVGSQIGKVNFTTDKDTMNKVVQVSGDLEMTTTVNQISLDSYFNIQVPNVIKIDVEGYELEVLYGMQDLLNKPTLKYIIVEIDGCQTESENVVALLHANGFQMKKYEPLSKTLTDDEFLPNTIRNYIFIKN